MKKGILIYQSKYGATKKYVQWLQDITDFDAVETTKASIEVVTQYETIVLCGGIYASGISGIVFLKDNIGKLTDKKIAVFGVGASNYEENVLTDIKEHNLIGDLEKIPLFYGRGAWNENKMKFLDMLLCKMLRKSLAKKDPATWDASMKTLMQAAGKNCDWTDKKYLRPLLDYLA